MSHRDTAAGTNGIGVKDVLQMIGRHASTHRYAEGLCELQPMKTIYDALRLQLDSASGVQASQQLQVGREHLQQDCIEQRPPAGLAAPDVSASPLALWVTHTSWMLSRSTKL